MKCPDCNASIAYTSSNILRESNSSGYMLRKIEAYTRIYEKFYYGNPDVALNYRLLREAVGHCICDMDRLTTFRGMDYADQHKKAAYAIKWLSRIKPVQMVLPKNQTTQSPTYTDVIAKANDYFSILAGLSELDSFTNAKLLSKKYIDNLAYLLHHHSIDADCLSSEMYVLDSYLRKMPV